VEGLSEGGFGADLAGADGFAAGGSEGFEEVVAICAAVEDAGGAGACGLAGEGGGDLGDCGDGVCEDLGLEPADEGVGEAAVVGGVGWDGGAGELIGAAGGDVLEEGADIEAGLDETVAEGGEEGFVAGRVGDAAVVDWFDDAAAEAVGPCAVG
jgi:hypothetical protein